MDSGTGFSEATLDTTVLAKAIIPPRRRKGDAIYREQARLFAVAKAILGKVEAGQLVMHVPSVAIVEIAAVAARLTGKEEMGVQAAEYVKAHGYVVRDDTLLGEAVRTAARTKASGFDSVFIACARLTGSVLLTDDKRMYETAVSAGIAARLLRQF